MSDDMGVRLSSAEELLLRRRLSAIYNAAFERAIKDIEDFLRKIDDVESGKYKPPKFYDTPEKVARWKQGFYRELTRKENVAAKVIEQINAAGVTVSPYIHEMAEQVYGINRDYMADVIRSAAGSQGLNVSFSQYDKRQIKVLLEDTQPAFSKIAYENLGKNTAVVRRLQNELIQATILGESQRKIIQRIRDVVGNAQYNAKRTAQTERTRVQSQARADTLHEAAQMGIRVTKRWSARMVNTRDTHAALNGTVINEDEKFVTTAGNELMYPGDPNAPAAEVINCHCVLVPDVVAGEDSARVLQKADNDGKMLPETKEAGSAGVQTIGRIDRDIFKCVTPDITTDEVIISEERIAHCNLHNNAFAKYASYIPDILRDPDLIFEDKHPNTALLIRRINEDGKSLQLVLRLHTPNDDPNHKNSVISFWDIGESRRRNYERNKRLLYKREQ